MPGKKMRSRKNNAHNTKYVRYSTQGRKRINKDRKAVAHEKLEVKKTEYSKKRAEIIDGLVSECNTKFKLGSDISRARYILKRIVGTLCIGRLRGLLDRNVALEGWFQSRPITPNLRSLLDSTGFPNELSDAMLVKKAT